MTGGLRRLLGPAGLATCIAVATLGIFVLTTRRLQLSIAAGARPACEANAIDTLRVLDAAITSFVRRTHRKPDSLGELAQLGLIDSQLATGIRLGYRFTLEPERTGYDAKAVPATRLSGDHTFLLAVDGKIVSLPVASGKSAEASGAQVRPPDPSEQDPGPPR